MASKKLPLGGNSFVRLEYVFEVGRFEMKEVHWISGVSDVAAGMAVALKVKPFRAAILGKGAALIETNCYLEGVNGAMLPNTDPIDTPVVYPASLAQGVADQAWSALLIRVRCDLAPDKVTTKYHKQLYLCGVPDLEISNPPAAVFSDQFGKPFEAWKAACITNGLSLLTYNRESDTPLVNIVNWVGQVGSTVITTQTPHNLNAGDTVRLYNCQSLPGPSPKGQFTVQSVLGNTFTIQGAYPTPVRLLNPGQMRKMKAILVPYREMVYIKNARRKRGTLSKPIRGRARKKKAVI